MPVAASRASMSRRTSRSGIPADDEGTALRVPRRLEQRTDPCALGFAPTEHV